MSVLAVFDCPRDVVEPNIICNVARSKNQNQGLTDPGSAYYLPRQYFVKEQRQILAPHPYPHWLTVH